MAQGDGRVLDVVEINPYAPRPHAFTESALCLRDAIRRAGLESEHRFNLRDPARACIVLGAVPPRLDSVDAFDPASTVIYNMEQFGTQSYGGDSAYLDWLRRWPLVADYHSANVDWLARRGVDAIELPIVPSPSVGYGLRPGEAPQNDIVFFGTPNPRRERLIDELRARGLSVEVVVGAFGEELAPALLRARLLLNVHYYGTALFPVARFLQAIAIGIPAVSENSVFSRHTDASESGILFAAYEQLPEACQLLLRDPAEAARGVERMRRWAAALDFAAPLGELRGRIDALQLAGPWRAPAGPPADGDLLTNEEIERILLEEAGELPPEQGHAAAPFKLVERTPGQGRYGVWIVLLMLIFSVYTIWAGMQR
jgi:hypothetical protein